MNFEITINASLINNKNHLINLHKHITRTAKKYESIKQKVFVKIIKILEKNTPYKNNLTHIVIEAQSYDFDDQNLTHEIFQKREKLEQDVLQIMGRRLVAEFDNTIKELTVVSGAQPDGTYIAPCMHIIYEAETENNELSISKITSTVKHLDNLISQAK